MPVFLPPHASNQLQPLDLCIFGPTKTLIRRINVATRDENIQSVHIGKVIEGVFKASSPDNIKSAFHMAGIVLEVVLEADPRNGKVRPRTYCKVDRSACRKLLPGLEEEDPEFLLDPDQEEEDVFEGADDDAIDSIIDHAFDAEFVQEPLFQLYDLGNGELELRQDFLEDSQTDFLMTQDFTESSQTE
jgi:hypothetical protein